MAGGKRACGNGNEKNAAAFPARDEELDGAELLKVNGRNF
jgi:hypothetical protein